MKNSDTGIAERIRRLNEKAGAGLVKKKIF